MEKVRKMQKAIDKGYWLVQIIKSSCINRVFCTWLSFDYFDVSISIYLWRRLLTHVTGTVPLMLVDGAKQAGLVGCSDSYLSKSRPVAIFFKLENFCA